MSVTSPRIHERIERLANLANDFLPDDVVFGYYIPHTHYPDDSVIPDSEIIRADADIKRFMRGDLQRRIDKGWSGADADLAALPDDAAIIGSVDVIFEMFHVPTRISVIRIYKLSQLISLATDDTKTTEEKRQIIKTQLLQFYADLQARLP